MRQTAKPTVKSPGSLKNEAKIHTHTEKRGKIETKTTISATTTNSNRQGQPQSAFCGFWTSGKSEHKHTHTNNTQAQINNSHTRRVRKREEGQRVAKSIAYFSAYTSQVTTKRVVASVCVFEWVCLCVFVCMYSRTGAE